MLKVGNASSEHRTRVKTEIAPIIAQSAVMLFFELIEFNRQMTELQIGESDFGLRWRSFRGKLVGASKTMVEELEAHPEVKRSIARPRHLKARLS